MTTIAFTGRSSPVPSPQRHATERVLEWLRDSGADRLRHGDCVEADAMADLQARDLGLKLEIHPGFDVDGASPKRAFCGTADDFEWKPLPYLQRNRVMVDRADILVAVPSSYVEMRRTGEWATVRYAVKTGVPVILVLPDGTITVADT